MCVLAHARVRVLWVVLAVAVLEPLWALIRLVAVVAAAVPALLACRSTAFHPSQTST